MRAKVGSTGRVLLTGVLALLGCLLGLACSSEDTQQPERPPMVVVVLDTLRPDCLGFLGHPRETAPFLAQLAQESVLMEAAVSTSSWTAPATASLFTGVYPDRHRVEVGLVAKVKRDRREHEDLRVRPIRGELATLPERLAAEGYRCFGLASNPNIRAELGFARGFERLECDPRASAEELAQRVRSWRPELEAGGPYFLYLHLNDIHSPYAKHEEFWVPPESMSKAGGAHLKPRYLSEISYVDDVLARLFADFGWQEDAVVAVVSDHGEEFKDHGATGHGPTLYAELNRSLILFRGPGEGFKSGRHALPASLVDVTPTLLELAGIERPRGLDGASLAGLADEEREAASAQALESRTLYAHRRSMKRDLVLWSASQEGWKLIVKEGVEGGELYDTRNDPGELQDLFSEQPDIAGPLELAITRMRARTPAPEDEEESDVPVDEELLDLLRQLGYVTGR